MTLTRAPINFCMVSLFLASQAVCVTKACGMHCLMVYAPIHAGTPTRCVQLYSYRKYTVFCSYSYLYRAHTNWSCVCLHSCKSCTRCAIYMSVPIHIYRTHTRCVMSYIHAQKEGLVMRIYIKHYCAFTAEILCV